MPTAHTSTCKTCGALVGTTAAALAFFPRRLRRGPTVADPRRRCRLHRQPCSLLVGPRLSLPLLLPACGSPCSRSAQSGATPAHAAGSRRARACPPPRGPCSPAGMRAPPPWAIRGVWRRRGASCCTHLPGPGWRGPPGYPSQGPAGAPRHMSRRMVLRPSLVTAACCPRPSVSRPPR